MRVLRRIIASLAVWSIVGGSEGADAPVATSLSDADRALFAWWDGLEYPDVERLPFGQYWSGYWSKLGDDVPKQGPRAAFLFSESAIEIRVFTTDLRVAVREKHDVAGEPWNRVAFDAADLLREVEAALPQDSAWAVPYGWEGVVVARACAGRGREDLAARLLARMREGGPRGRGVRADDSAAGADPWLWVRREVALTAGQRRDETFGDDAATWRSLFDEQRRYIRRALPADRVAATADLEILRAMAARAAERGAQPACGVKAGSIEDLVQALQEVRGAPMYESEIWTWFRTRDAPPQPHERLADLGLPAAPALVAALDDRRFTRTVRRWNDLAKGAAGEVRDVLRVRDLAWRTLDRISGGALGDEHEMRAPPDTGAARAAVRAWFATVEGSTAAQALARSVRAGRRTALGAAHRLASLDPATAVAAIEAGIGAAEDADTRGELARILAQVPGEGATAALLRLLASTAGPVARVPVAIALWSRERREGLDALVVAWHALSDEAAVPRPFRDPAGEALTDALAVIVESRDASAIRALAAGLSNRRPHDRLGVVARLHDRPRFETVTLRSGHSFTRPVDEPRPPLSEEASRAVEALLADRLEDEVRVEGRAMDVGAATSREPVIGELAAWVLSTRFPGRWTFDPNAPAGERSRARLALANAWRVSNGRPPLAEAPPDATPTPVPLETLRAHLDRVAGGTDAAREAAERVVLSFGLAALPAVRAYATSMRDAPGRATVDALARRLSLTVAEATRSAGSAPSDGVFDSALAAAKGMILSGELLVGLLQRVVSDPPKDAFGVALRAERLDAGRGVTIRATLVRQPDETINRGHPGVHVTEPRIRRGSVERGGGHAYASDSRNLPSYAVPGWIASIDAELEESTLDEEVVVELRFAFER